MNASRSASKLSVWVGVILTLGCSAEIRPNPECLSPGRTYTEAFTRVYGDCPDLSPEVIQLSPEGTLPLGSGETCDEVETDECSTTNQHCTYLADSCKLSSTFSATFEADGSKGVGFIDATLTCEGGDWCFAVYRVNFKAN